MRSLNFAVLLVFAVGIQAWAQATLPGPKKVTVLPPVVKEKKDPKTRNYGKYAITMTWTNAKDPKNNDYLGYNVTPDVQGCQLNDTGPIAGTKLWHVEGQSSVTFVCPCYLKTKPKAQTAPNGPYGAHSVFVPAEGNTTPPAC